MNSLIISIIAVLIVCFIIIITDCILKNKLSCIFVSESEDEESIEAKLRILLKKHPNSEIIVITDSSSQEKNVILEKISSDYPAIHIIKSADT